MIFHQSRAWTDAGSRGFELTLDRGRPFFGLIHFWPGNAIAVRARQPLPLEPVVTPRHHLRRLESGRRHSPLSRTARCSRPKSSETTSTRTSAIGARPAIDRRTRTR